MRPRDRGDRRAHGLEAATCTRRSRRTSRRTRSSRRNTSGLSHRRRSREALPEAIAAALLRRALLQSAALHAPGRADPGADDRPALLDELEAFLTTTLGKGVIRAKDTPNFIANRVGVFSMLATMHHTPRLRPRLRRRRRADRPGDRPPEERDLPHRRRRRPRHDGARHQDDAATRCRTIRGTRYFATPPVLRALIAQGALGAEDQRGRLPKVGKDIQVLDPASGDYVASGGQAPTRSSSASSKIARRPRSSRSCARSKHPQAQFLWSIFRDLLPLRARITSADIADNARDVDLAIRWGFGWQRGRSRLWQAAGWAQVAQWIAGGHRRRQGAGERAAAGVGVDGDTVRATGRAPPEGS